MKFYLLPFLLFSAHIMAQSVDYNDVGVIINLNSPASMQIGTYFQTARNIPTQNLIYVSAPTTEVINDAEFEQLRLQIENHLTSQNLQDQLNYLVTTKGIPLKRNGIDCIVNTNQGDCGSVDQELSLILGPHAGGIGATNGYNNPYYEENTHFSRAQFGIYLVTRLDGYELADVISLIDRSGPNTVVNQQEAQVVLDIFETTSIDTMYFIDNFLAPSQLELQNQNWNSTTDYQIGTPSSVQNALAYIGIGHGPTDSVVLNYKWLPGSFSSMNTCSGAHTFDASSNPTNQFLLAQLIQDGCTAAHGYVNCMYITLLFETDIMLNRYLDTTAGYNLAESYFMAERMLSYQSVLIGDPKASILIDQTAGMPQGTLQRLEVYPNPSNSIFKLKGLSNYDAPLQIQVFNAQGQLISMQELSENDCTFEIDLPGFYTVAVYQDAILLKTLRLVRQ